MSIRVYMRDVTTGEALPFAEVETLLDVTELLLSVRKEGVALEGEGLVFKIEMQYVLSPQDGCAYAEFVVGEA